MAAPMLRNLAEYLQTHPSCEEYNGQDRAIADRELLAVVKKAGDASTVIISRDDTRARCTKLLELLMKTEGADVFCAPVPRDLYPEYYQEIIEPMDFGTVKKKLTKVRVSADQRSASGTPPPSPPCKPTSL